MKQATYELGKIQWRALQGRSALDNLPPDAALVAARCAFDSILARIERLTDAGSASVDCDTFAKSEALPPQGAATDGGNVCSLFERAVRDVLTAP